MAEHFSFPPPPPPPPRATATNGDESSSTHSASGGGIRGRGRGRGTNQPRGSISSVRGNHQGLQQNASTTARFSKGWQRFPTNENMVPQTNGGYVNSGLQGVHQTVNQNGYGNNASPPNFPQNSFPNQQFEITPFMQARFMQMMQNHANNQSRGILGGNSNSQGPGWQNEFVQNGYVPSTTENLGVPSDEKPKDTASDLKRKLNESVKKVGSPNQKKTRRTSSFSGVAPAVPSFGAPLPVVTPKSAPKPAGQSEKQADGTPAPTKSRTRSRKKRKTNQLGLTPAGEDRENSEEDDDGEEARLATVTGPLSISYKGKSWNLRSKEDVAAWKEERRKNWPTRARLEAAQKAQGEQAAAKKAAFEARQKHNDAKSLERHVKKREAVPEKEKGKMDEQKRKRDCKQSRNKRRASEEIESQPYREAIAEVNLRNEQKELRQKLVASAEKKKEAENKREQDEAKNARAAASTKTQLSKVERLRKQLEQAEQEAAQSAATEASSKSKKPAQTGEKTSMPETISRVQFEPPSEESSEMSSSESSSSSEVSSDPDPDPSDSDSDSDSDSAASSAGDLSSDAGSPNPSVSSFPARNSHSLPAIESTSHPSGTPNLSNQILPPGICHTYYKWGKCKYGSNCKWPHQKQPKKTGQDAQKGHAKRVEGKVGEGKPGRKSLYQRLVDQEQAREADMALAAIKATGEKGVFEEE